MTIKGEYGKSELGNFKVVDTIGTPHPYCIGPRHVAHAADHFGGMLGKDAIESGERIGIRCCTRGCNLDFHQHEQALLVECRAPLSIEDEKGKTTNPELHAYLLKCKEACTRNGYAGFAFVDKRGR